MARLREYQILGTRKPIFKIVILMAPAVSLMAIFFASVYSKIGIKITVTEETTTAKPKISLSFSQNNDIKEKSNFLTTTSTTTSTLTVKKCELENAAYATISGKEFCLECPLGLFGDLLKSGVGVSDEVRLQFR